MPKSLKTFLLILPIFFTIIFIITFRLTTGFFEQDEWLGIANVMNSYSRVWWYAYIPWVHFSPLAIFFWSILYKIFHLQAQYYFLVELLIHAACASLVFILALNISKNKTIGLITSLLFLINGRAHQAFTHLAIFHTTDSAMFFILLFMVYLSSIKEKFISLKKVLILTVIFLAAVGFREEGFIIIPIAGVYLLCFDKEKINKSNFIKVGFFVLGVVAFIILRLFAQTLNKFPIPEMYQVTGGNGVGYNLATIPIKFVVQNLVWSERFAQFYVVNTGKLYPDIESFFSSHAPIMDAGFFYFFSLLVIIFAFWLWSVRPKNIGKIIIFLSTWVLANAFMLAFVGRHLSVIEPRYLYYSSFPVLFLVAIFAYSTFTSKSKFRSVNIIKKIFSVILIATLLYTSVREIRIAVWRQVNDGIAKKKIIGSLLAVHPKLENNTIFFVECKGKCTQNSIMFGIPDRNVLPFSSGPGMNFLVVYASNQHQEKEWGKFFTEEWLFHTFSEGYKKIDGRSYGYFVTKGKLEQTLRKNNLSKNIVVALEYNERTYSFLDISDSFRKTLNVK